MNECEFREPDDIDIESLYFPASSKYAMTGFEMTHTDGKSVQRFAPIAQTDQKIDVILCCSSVMQAERSGKIRGYALMIDGFPVIVASIEHLIQLKQDALEVTTDEEKLLQGQSDLELLCRLREVIPKDAAKCFGVGKLVKKVKRVNKKEHTGRKLNFY